jgi:hypothetical protein
MAAAVAMAAAVSSPAAAHAQTGCAWWDLTCNGLSNTVTDYGWHAAGRDANENLVYVRRLVDANGNVVFEQAHRNTAGRYLIGNTHTIRKGTVYGSDGTVCKYNSNDKGYKEDCKYARGTVLAGVVQRTRAASPATATASTNQTQEGTASSASTPRRQRRISLPLPTRSPFIMKSRNMERVTRERVTRERVPSTSSNLQE